MIAELTMQSISHEDADAIAPIQFISVSAIPGNFFRCLLNWGLDVAYFLC
jgi:hypothetical protein